MTVTVNGRPARLEPGATVVDVLAGLGGERPGTAVAVNGAVVPRSGWSAHRLDDGDAVEVLVATQGG